jgi:hypothetical protein
MDSGWPVDIPRAQVHVNLGRRRHRVVTLPSGLLLFVCLFLPAVKGCGHQPVYAFEMPYFWHPYLYGGVLAIAALASTHRALARATIAVRTLAVVVFVGSLLMTAMSPGFGTVLFGIAAVQLAVIGLRGVSEKRIAASGIVVASLSLLWFGLWSGSSDAMIGVYLSFIASIFLLAGSLKWLSEI